MKIIKYIIRVILSIFWLPALVYHELAHMIIGLILLEKPTEVYFIINLRQPIEGRVNYGKILRSYKAFLIGLAPLIFFLIILVFAFYYTFLWYVIVYMVLSFSYSLPTVKDINTSLESINSQVFYNGVTQYLKYIIWVYPEWTEQKRKEQNISDVLYSIYDFVKVKESYETIYKLNTYSNRLKWLMSFLDKLEIEYFIDEWGDDDDIVRNICMPGRGEKMVIAHYDIRNLSSDNANDNSASVINAIALKLLNPDVHVVLTDGEEEGSDGAKLLNLRIINPDSPFYKTDWVLNLELTGYGEGLMVSNYSNGSLFHAIKKKYHVKVVKELPRNDSYYLNRKGTQSEVISLCPVVLGKNDISHFDDCHTLKDSIDKIDIHDMEGFVLNVLLPLTQ